MSALGLALGLPFSRPAGGGFVGVLDGYTTNLSLALSLSRTLLSSYTGPWYKVRRASDNTELDITSNAQVETFCSGTDGFLVQLYDQAEVGGDFFQSTASQQPKIVSSGTRIQDANGHTVMQFDSSDDVLVPFGAAPTYSDYTFIAAAYLDNLEFFNMIFSLKNDRHEMREQGGQDFAQFLYGNATSFESTDNILDIWRTWTAQASTGGDAAAYLDSNSYGSTTGATIDATDQFFLGARDSVGSFSWDGMIGEVIVHNTMLDGTTRAAIETIIHDWSA